MAALPRRPRRTSASNDLEDNEDTALSALEALQGMGFIKTRAIKALVATGDRGPQLAANWLLTHMNDPTLDQNTPRDFIVYLCPRGNIQKQLERFVKASRKQCDWNSAHDCMPHVTLCSFMKVDDSQVQDVIGAFNYVIEALIVPLRIELEYFTSNNFIGLFVEEQCATRIREVMEKFSRMLRDKVGLILEGHMKQLHVTLAYQYQDVHHATLEHLSKSIDLTQASAWDIRLYSRDARMGKNHTEKVHHPYQVEYQDELKLVEGDYIFKHSENCVDSGWYRGVSWLTGVTGLYPGNHTRRCASTDAWTLHGYFPVTESSFKQPTAHHQSVTRRESQLLIDVQENQVSEIQSLYTKVVKGKRSSAPQRLVVVRHGERVDNVFGHDWFRGKAFQKGTYMCQAFNLNMPEVLPDRLGGPEGWEGDSPVTQVGLLQGKLLGGGLRDNGFTAQYVYCSPSFRCMQTANEIIKAFTDCELLMRVEPGLFEWCGWYRSGMPRWFTAVEYAELGFKVDTSYQPIVPYDGLNLTENLAMFYARGADVTNGILQGTAGFNNVGGTILIVGHAATLDSATRKLFNKPTPSNERFIEFVRQVQYVGACICEDGLEGWRMLDTRGMTVKHGLNKSVDLVKLMP